MSQKELGISLAVFASFVAVIAILLMRYKHEFEIRGFPGTVVVPIQGLGQVLLYVALVMAAAACSALKGELL